MENEGLAAYNAAVQAWRRKVLSVSYELSTATIQLALGCGHTQTFSLTDGHPIASIEETYGLPEIGDEVTCEICAARPQ